MAKSRFFTAVWITGIVLVVLLVIGLGTIVVVSSYSLSTFGGDKIGVVDIRGVIRDSREINKEIISFKDRSDIKAIVLRINSPGGGVGPSQEIYEEVKKAKSKKKVVVSMGAVAASGGYYIASAADKIVANPGTITGSIGVIMEFANIEELFSKLGLKGYVIKSGEFKDIGSPLREIDLKEKKLLQQLVDNVHQQFVKAISDSRGVETEDVQKIADGRILSGAQAKDARLVDELGNLLDAIELAARLAGIKGKPNVIYPKRKRITLWNFLFGKGSFRLLERFENLNYGPQFLLYF